MFVEDMKQGEVLAADRRKSGVRRAREAGFTLVELLAVVVILGIIAAIAVPLIGNIINKSREDATRGVAISMYEAARLYIVSEKGGDFKNAEVTLKELQEEGYMQKDTKDGYGEPIEAENSKVKFDEYGNLSQVVIKSPKVNEEYTADEIFSRQQTSGQQTPGQQTQEPQPNS
ncbi:MAG: Type IV pilin PilA [Hydrogenibacillus schlegelii]|uniref:Type IV pilin PilA n=1 Tax=Hydrogenibacillus schlegelii TaxID=1484 RepID=A0A2T5GEI1_HYDSH|nr:type II secretion system protein [Hydrogenibacillus schlegelii]PTQ54598.1 MAG: Type IV pilin PilA [Hydrogenibacillus schlegelii]